MSLMATIGRASPAYARFPHLLLRGYPQLRVFLKGRSPKSRRFERGPRAETGPELAPKARSRLTATVRSASVALTIASHVTPASEARGHKTSARPGTARYLAAVARPRYLVVATPTPRSVVTDGRGDSFVASPTTAFRSFRPWFLPIRYRITNPATAGGTHA